MLKAATFRFAKASGLLQLIRTRYAGPGAILMFHQIHGAGDRELRTGVTHDFLDRTLHWLRRNGWDIVSMEEFGRRLATPSLGRFAVFTFDDGYRDNLTLALPVLERHGAPFTIYVATGAIERTLFSWWLGLRQICRDNDTLDIEPMGRRFACDTIDKKVAALDAVCKWVHQDYRRKASMHAVFSDARLSFEAINDTYYMNLRELRALARHPLATIGGHTHSHAAIATLEAPAALEEIISNRNYLADMTQKEHVTSGFRTVTATRWPRDFAFGENRRASQPRLRHRMNRCQRHPIPLPRIGVRNNDTFITLDARISGLRKAVNSAMQRTPV